MRRPRRASQTIALLSLCTATIAVACVKGPTEGSSGGFLGPTDTAIAGSYNLAEIGGLPLPSTTQVNAQQAIEVDSERIVIAADRTWADTSTTVIVDVVSGNTSLPTRTRVVFTAHSLPERVLEGDVYVEELASSARGIATEGETKFYLTPDQVKEMTEGCMIG